ncbi:MAG: hypothetical protein AAB652_00425 [Patescibacteria group bacterium]
MKVEKRFRKRSARFGTGQAMILTVLALGGAILGATAIAGLLMVYQIRQSTDLGNSAKAIFAADTGSEWGLFQFSCVNDPTKVCDAYGSTTIPFANGATVKVLCYDDAENELPDCVNADPVNPTVKTIKAVGSAGRSSRAFFLDFGN